MVRTRDDWLTVFLWRSLGASWGLLGASWGPLGALSGASWGPLGASWVPAPPTRPPTVWLNALSVLLSFKYKPFKQKEENRVLSRPRGAFESFKHAVFQRAGERFPGGAQRHEKERRRHGSKGGDEEANSKNERLTPTK